MITPLDAARIEEIVAREKRLRALRWALRASYELSQLDKRVAPPAAWRDAADRAWLAAGAANAEKLAAEHKVAMLQRGTS